jgi:1-acyl-sn-glycerol-3-phosphate acyltransferase
MYSILRVLTRWFLTYFLRFFCAPKVKGFDKLRGIKGPLIVAANHDGRIDPVWIDFLIEKANPYEEKEIRFLVWYKYYDMPILGWYIKAMRGFRVINKQGLGILDPAVDFLNSKGMIGIFPEGKIKKQSDKDRKAKRGIAYLAWKSKAPILPIYLKYHKRWKKLPFYNLHISIGEQFTIHENIKNENDLLNAAALVLPHIYNLSIK